MTGALNDRVNELAKRFNDSQSEYKVVAVYKGSYPESMAAAIAASRAGNAPHILQVFEVGTATMMAAKGAIKPVHEVMAQAGEKFDPKAYIPAVAGYYTTPKGQMLSFPFNSSTTVFYYNKDAFEKAGLDPNRPPQDVARGRWRRRRSSRRRATQCAYTTGWPSWTQLENFSAWHNVPFATKENGFGGSTRSSRSTARCRSGTSRTSQDWSKKGYFTTAGASNEAGGEVLQRRMRDADVDRRPPTPTSSSNAKFKFGDRAAALLRRRRRARRRTRSSAARRCG